MSQLTTLARPYARAAFESAVAAGALASWSSGLGLLAALMVDEKVAGYMSVPSHSSEEKAQTLINLCGDELDSKLQNFIQLLANNKRLGLLGEIHVMYEALKAEQEKSIEVEVVSAFELDSAEEAQLITALKNRLQSDIKVVSSVDKSLIGGMVIRAGDLVIDGSIRGKLNKLTETMNA